MIEVGSKECSMELCKRAKMMLMMMEMNSRVHSLPFICSLPDIAWFSMTVHHMIELSRGCKTSPFMVVEEV